jgi:hypothetical protein
MHESHVNWFQSIQFLCAGVKMKFKGECEVKFKHASGDKNYVTHTSHEVYFDWNEYIYGNNSDTYHLQPGSHQV